MQEYIPILQFGQFSPTFEYKNNQITFGDIIGLAAFVQLPRLNNTDSIFRYQISKNYLLIEKKQFRENVLLFHNTLLNSSAINKIREEFTKMLMWNGWEKITYNKFKFSNYEPIVRFCHIFQMVWLGTILKELIVNNYRDSLRQSFSSMEPDEFESLFLDTLINPGFSYILNNKKENLNDTSYSRSEDNIYNCDMELRISRIKSLIRFRKAIDIIKKQEDYHIWSVYLDIIKTLTWLSEEKNNKIYEIKLKINKFYTKNKSLELSPLLLEEGYNNTNISNSLYYIVNFFEKYRNFLSLNL